MSLEKSELKALIAEGFAADFFEAKEKAAQGVHKFSGLKEGFQKVEELLNLQSQTVRNLILKEGLPCDGSNPVEVGQFIVSQLMEVSRKVHKLSEDAGVSQIRAEGGVLSLQKVIDHLSSKAQVERNKIEIAKKMAESELSGLAQTEIANIPGLRNMRGPTGAHPGRSLKSLRKAEAEAQKEKEEKPEEENSGKHKKKKGPSKSVKKRTDIMKKAKEKTEDSSAPNA